MTTPADPFAVVRTKKYLALLILATVLGVVISFLIYWFLKLIADIQTWVFTDLPKGLGFHGEQSGSPDRRPHRRSPSQPRQPSPASPLTLRETEPRLGSALEMAA